MKCLSGIFPLTRSWLATVFSFCLSSSAIAGSALSFDGANDYVTLGAAPGLGRPTFTVETWFKRTGAGVSASTGTGGVTAIPLVTKGRSEADGTTQDMNYFLGIQASNNVLCADFEEGATGAQPGLNHPVVGVTPIANNVWYHAAVTYDGTKWQLFLNGVLERELVVNRPPRADSIQRAALGSALNSTGVAAGFFAGVIDEARIWDHARPAQEIADNKNLEIQGAPGLIGRWGLNEGSGTVAADSSGSGINGTLTNGPLWVAGFDPAVATSITRGPYLQQGTPTSVIVRWRTNVATNSEVRFGDSPSALTATASDAAFTTEHQVALTGLTPDTQYYYSVGSSTATLATGSEFTFFTAPLVGTARPTRIWVLGDSGTKDAVAASVRNGYTTFAADRYTDVWLMLGDNAYQNGTDAEYQAAVFDMYPTYLRQSVLWTTIGNHDTASSTNPPLTIPHFQMFTNPTNGEAGGVPSGTEKYYSFDYGRIHFICLDSMTSSRAPGSAMLTWLQNDLASTTQDWIIAFFHHPPYTKGSHNSDTETELIQMRTNVLPILEAGGVDLVLTGHSHSYERTFLIDGHYGLSTTFSGQHLKDGGSGREGDTGAYEKPADLAANQGAVYVVAGNGGHVTNWVGGSTAEFNPNPHPAMFYSALHVGSLVLDVDGNRLDAKMIRETGAVDDYFTIIKNAPNEPPTVSIASPAEGAIFIAPANIAITANAADSDGTVAQVDFYAGATLIASDTAAPFGVTWNNVGPGSYALTATAIDNLGAIVTSAPVNITVGTLPNEPPVVSITAPSEGASFTAPATIQVNANATDSDGTVTQVAFYAGQTLIGSDATAPFGVTWSNVGPGSYTLTATATDNLGAIVASTPVNITVGTLPNEQPVVSITAPSEGASFMAPTTIQVSANATDSDGTVTQVAFYAGQTLIGTDPTAPFSITWASVGAGTYALTAVATDNSGAATTSVLVNVTVMVPAPVAPNGLIATAGNAQVVLSWGASSGATSYHVQRATTSGGPYASIATGIVATIYTDTTAANGTTYFYVVTAINAGGESGYSNEANATPTAPVVIPAAPGGLVATAVSRTEINLTWTDNSANEDGFRIERSADGGGFVQIGTVAPDIRSFASTGLQANKNYRFRVRAYNVAGNSAYSNTATAKTLK